MNIINNWKNFAEKLTRTPVGDTTLADVVIKIALFLSLLVIIPLLFSSERSLKYTDMKPGDIATKKVVAPFTFNILKSDEELAEQRKEAKDKVPFYFVRNDSITSVQLQILDEVLPFLLNNVPDDTSLVNKRILINQVRDKLATHYDIRISESNLQIIFDLLQDRQKVAYLNNTITYLKGIVRTGILDISLSEISRPLVVVVKNGIEESLAGENRYDMSEVESLVENKLLEHFNVNQMVVLKYLFAQILTPNLIYNRSYTESSLETALNNIPLYKDVVYENEGVVDANERITPEIYQKLYSLEKAREERSRRGGHWPDIASFLAKIMLLASILLVVGLYLYSFRKKVFADNKKLLMMALILLLVFVMASVLTGPLNWQAYVIPTTIASMLLAILIDSGIAFVGTVVIALVLGGIQGSGYDISLLTIVSGMVSIFTVHRIRTRNQVFRAIIFISLAYLWVIFAFYIMRYDSLQEGLQIFAYNLLPNAVLSPFITFMVLGIFEKIFDITTDVTLLELSDLNHPLLKRLSLEAPGTFHHSMVVGNLAENAAKAIGANSLLARVGSYYHDIGKMEKPEYFVENQMDADNRHNQLSANMSALILASHVKNGIELAKRYGIPKLIRDFIPEHHGTNVMTYFYNKAVEKMGEKEVNEADFRYPGPKPQSRETGIVMLADAVEAASRVINNPTPNKIRALVEDLVDKRFKEAELDECDLTLRDLKGIIDAFLPVLQGVFQHRIEYPDADKKKGEARPGVQKSKPEKSVKNGNRNPSV